METRTEAPPQPRGTVVEGRSVPGGPVETVETHTTTTRRRPPLWILALGALVVIAALVWGVSYLAYASTHQTTDDARVDADTVTVTSKIPERISAILVDTNAPVKQGQVLIRLDRTDEQNAVQQARAALDAQRAQARAAQENVALTRAQVQAQATQGAGGVAAAQSQIAAAAAQTQAAQQQADAARAAIAQAQAQLKVAQSQVPSSRAGLARANADLQRYTALVRSGDVAAQQLDAQRALQAQAQAQYQSALDNVVAAQTAVTQAQARYTAAVSSTSAAGAAVGAQQGQLQTAQGRLTESDNPYRVSATQAQADAAFAQAGSLQAQLKTAQDRLTNTEIRSPINGVVGAKNVEVGMAITPGQSLMTLVPSKNVYITANYKETQLGKVRVGQSVDIKLDAYKGVTFHGHVASIAPASQNTFSLVQAQNATGNFVKVAQRLPVRIVIDNPPADTPLRVGMNAVTSIATGR